MGIFEDIINGQKPVVESVPEEKHEEEMNFDDFFTEMMHEMDNELIAEGYDSSLV